MPEPVRYGGVIYMVMVADEVIGILTGAPTAITLLLSILKEVVGRSEPLNTRISDDVAWSRYIQISAFECHSC